MAERTEQFSLRWNNFHSNLTAGFHELLQASEMVDVTLAVEGHLFQAHKLVLSICSPYFKEIFKTIPCKHPVVILKDVSHENIKDIIEFMYMGEVNVLRENLSAFLRTAEHLQVKGLTGDDSSETSSRKEDKPDSVVDQDEEQDLMQFNHIIDSDVELPASYNSPIVPTPAMTPQLPQNPQNKRNGKASQANATTKRPKIETIARKSPNSKNDNELSKNWSHSDESEVLDTKIIKSEQNDEGDVEGMKQLIDNNLGNPVLNDQSEQVENFGQEWETAQIVSETSYRAGTSAKIKAAEIGIKIGLRSVNITLKSIEKDSKLSDEIIDYNERFSWTWDQGNDGFGTHAGLLQREYRAAQIRGLPFPILWIVEYFVIDGEHFRIGRFYRTAGWYSHIALWGAFACWLLAILLFRSVIRYGGYILCLSGILQLTAVVVWSVVRNPRELLIPFESATIRMKYGWTYWLTGVVGVFCVLVGMAIVIVDRIDYKCLYIFFDLDPLKSEKVVSYYTKHELMEMESKKLKRRNGKTDDIELIERNDHQVGTTEDIAHVEVFPVGRR